MAKTLDDYMALAIGAMNAGKDPAKVNARLKEIVVSKGLAPPDTVFNLQPDPKEKAPSQWDNVQAGSATNTFPDVESGVSTNYFGDVDNPRVAQGLNFLRSASKETGGLLGKGLAGLSVAGGGLLSLNPQEQFLPPEARQSTQAFEAADALSKAADQEMVGVEDAGKTAGSLVGGLLPTSIVGMGPEAAREALDQTGSLPKAYKELGKSTAANEAMLALGLPFKGATGLLGVAKRAAVQVPGSVGIAAAEKALSGEDFTKEDAALAAGMGAFGSLFGERARAPKSEIPKTGDAAFDAGVEAASPSKEYDFGAAAKRQSDIINRRKEPEQGDLFTQSGESQVQGDLFGKHVDASTAEYRRAEDILSGADRHPDQQAALERNYFQQRQERLRQQQEAIDNATREQGLAELEQQYAAGNNPEAAAQHPDLWDVRTPVNEQPVEATLQGTLDNPTGYTEEAPNDAMRQAFRDAGLRRAKGLQNENIYPDIRSTADAEALVAPEAVAETQGDLFNPTQPKVVEQTQEQFAFPEQQDMFNRGPSKEGFVPYSRKTAEAPTSKSKTLEQSLQEARARRAAFLEGQSGGVEMGNPLFSTKNVPQTWKAKLADGSLTFHEVLRDVARGDAGVHPEISEYAKYLQELDKKLGGADVKFKAFDENDPLHASYLAQKALSNQQPGFGYYSQSAHEARLDPEMQTVHAYLHEGTHAITARALQAGLDGKLSGEQALAFGRLKKLFDYSAGIVKDKAGPKSDFKGFAEQYGVTNLHEFMTETYTNPIFRNQLKKIKLSEVEKAVPEFSSDKAKFHRLRTMYDAVVSGIRNMLGMSPKMDTLLDAVISGGHEFFDKSAGQSIARGRGVLNADRPEELQKPRSKVVVAAKALLSSKGIEPIVHYAKKTKQGIANEGELEAAQSAKRLRRVTSKENESDIGRAMEGDVASLKRLDPAAQQVVKAEWLNNYDRSLKIGEQIALDPNATAKQKEIGQTIIERAGNYQTRAYAANEIKGYMKDKAKLYEQAKKAIAAGKEPTAEQASAFKDFDTARKYLEQTWLPDVQNLASRHTDELEQLYKFHTGLDADAQLKGLKGDTRRDAMVGAIADKMRKMADKDKVLDDIVMAAAGLGDKKNTQRRYFGNLRRSGGIYSELGDVPEELRQFWGELKNPIARNLATVRTQYNYLSNLAAQNQLRAEGMGKIFSEARNGTHDEAITGEKMGPLQGLFTTPDVKKAMDSVFQMDKTAGDWIDSLIADGSGVSAAANLAARAVKPVRKIAGITKLASVLGNVGNFANNFVGSPMQLLSNGNISPTAIGKGIKMMIDTTLADRRSGLSPDARDAFRYGLVEYSHMEELRGSKAASRIKQYMEEAYSKPNPVQWLYGKVREAGRLGLEGYKELYSAMDLYTKMANWHNELDFWKGHNEKHGINMSEDQLKEFVARRINDTNITPSMAPPVLRFTEATGLSRFATYYSEVARTLKNNFMVGVQDVRDGLANGQLDLARHGIARLSGVGGSMVAYNKYAASIAKAAAAAAGLAATQLADDDPRKKYMDKDKFWNSQDSMILADPEHPEDGEYAYDLSRPNPYAPITTPLNHLYEALALAGNGKTKEAQDKAEQAFDNISGLWASNTMWKALSKVWNDSKPSTARTAEDAYNFMHEQLTKAGVSAKGADNLIAATEPLVLKTAANIAQSNKLESTPLKYAVASGIGAQKLDIASDVGSFVGASAKKEINKAKNSYADLMKANYESSPERLEKAFISTLKDAAKPYEKLRLGVEAAKEQGATRRDLVARLKAAGISEGMISTLLRNEPLKVTELAADLKKDLEQDMLGATQDKKQEAKERFRYNMTQLNTLLRQYRTVDVDEL